MPAIKLKTVNIKTSDCTKKINLDHYGYSVNQKRLGLLGWDRQIQLELSRQFFLGVQSVREVDPTNATVGVNLSKHTDIQTTVICIINYIRGLHYLA